MWVLPVSYLLEDRDHPEEESVDLRLTPGTGQCHAPAITSCLLLLLQTQLCTWGQWGVNSEGIGQVARIRDRWSGTQGLQLYILCCRPVSARLWGQAKDPTPALCDIE